MPDKHSVPCHQGSCMSDSRMCLKHPEAVPEFTVVSGTHCYPIPVYTVAKHINMRIGIAVFQTDKSPIWFDRESHSGRKLDKIRHGTMHPGGVGPKQIDVVHVNHDMGKNVPPLASPFRKIAALASVVNVSNVQGTQLN